MALAKLSSSPFILNIDFITASLLTEQTRQVGIASSRGSFMSVGENASGGILTYNTLYAKLCVGFVGPVLIREHFVGNRRLISQENVGNLWLWNTVGITKVLDFREVFSTQLWSWIEASKWWNIILGGCPVLWGCCCIIYKKTAIWPCCCFICFFNRVNSCYDVGSVALVINCCVLGIKEDVWFFSVFFFCISKLRVKYILWEESWVEELESNKIKLFAPIWSSTTETLVWIHVTWSPIYDVTTVSNHTHFLAHIMTLILVDWKNST